MGEKSIFSAVCGRAARLRGQTTPVLVEIATEFGPGGGHPDPAALRSKRDSQRRPYNGERSIRSDARDRGS